MSKKKLIIGIVTLVVLIIGGVTAVYLVRQQQDIRNRAAPATTVSVLPATKTMLVGEQQNFTVNIDSTTNTVSGVKLEITFDPNKLQLLTFTPGPFLTVVFEQAQIDNTQGRATLTLGAQASNPPQGTGILATLKFQAKSTGTNVLIGFGSQTQASGITSGNKETGDIIVSKNPATLTIAQTQASASASPTASATPTPTGTATATPKASGSPTASPTASPAAGGTATATPAASPTVTLPVSGTLTPGQTISGTAAPNSTVTITIKSQTISTTVKADSTGKWSYTIPATLEAGTHTITITDSNGTTTKTFKIAASGSTESAQPVPDTGIELPTILVGGIGMMLLVAGIVLAL